jgi:hypothetical protein
MGAEEPRHPSTDAAPGDCRANRFQAGSRAQLLRSVPDEYLMGLDSVVLINEAGFPVGTASGRFGLVNASSTSPACSGVTTDAQAGVYRTSSFE